MEQKIEKQKFYISEFEQEAAWLSFMQKEGWKFVSTDGWHYTFESCEKEEWIYQLDFKEDGLGDEDYIQMFADYGWEYVCQLRQWFYFRKKRVSENEDLSIFSNRESKVDLCKRIINGQLIHLLPLYFLMLACDYVIIFTDFLNKEGFFGVLLGCIVAVTVLVIAFSFGNYIGQLSRLQHIMKENED